MVTSIFRLSRAAYSEVGGRIFPNFELIQARMYVILTCKYEEELIDNSREKVAIPFFPFLYQMFSDAKGQLAKGLLTPYPVTGFDPISNSSKLLCCKY